MLNVYLWDLTVLYPGYTQMVEFSLSLSVLRLQPYLGSERVRCKSVSAGRHPLVSAGAGPAGHHPPGGQHRSWTLHIQTTSSTSTAISCTCALRVEAAVRHVNLDDHQPGPHRRNVGSILLPDLKLVFCNIVNTCLILTALQHYTLHTFNQVQKYYL